MGLISDNDERAYLEEQEAGVALPTCEDQWNHGGESRLVSGTLVFTSWCFRYLGVHISQDLSWCRYTNSLAKKARQRLYHLRRLRDFRLPSKVPALSRASSQGNITVWFGNSTKQDRQALQRVVRSAERITYTELPDLQTIYYKRCQTKARRIVKDPTHPNNRLFSLLRSGRRFRSLKTKTERLKRSFFPQAIRATDKLWGPPPPFWTEHSQPFHCELYCKELLYRSREGDVVKFDVEMNEITVLVPNRKFTWRQARYRCAIRLKRTSSPPKRKKEVTHNIMFVPSQKDECVGMGVLPGAIHHGQPWQGCANGKAVCCECVCVVSEMYKASRYEVSPDMKHVLLAYNVQPVYQYSFNAYYIICSLETPETWILNPPEVRNAYLQYAGWGPQGQQLIFIFENNIYYRATVENRSIRLVSTGKEDVIFNGLSDWLYEEEMFQSHIAHWWSPDGARLAYATINNTLVPKMEVPMFTGSLYPTSREYHYPKAGEENPIISLYVVNLNGPLHTIEMRKPEDPRIGEYYITMVKWATSTKLAVNWLNRAQNISILTLCEATTGVCAKCIYMCKHEDESESWLHRQNEAPLFSRDGLKLFFTRAIPQGGMGKFFHISMAISQVQPTSTQCYRRSVAVLDRVSHDIRGGLVNRSSNTSSDTLQSITSGDWDVTQVLAYSENSQLIYFLSTEDDPKRRHLYSADTVGPFNRRCLSCDFADSCGYVNGHFSHDMTYFLLNCKGPGVPFVAVYHTQDRGKLFDIELNLNLRRTMDSLQMPIIEYRTIDIEDYALTMQILKPAGFIDTAHYPLLLIVDGTPGGQVVSEQFRVDWATVLVSSFDVIAVRLDGRGSGFQGTNLLHKVQRRLGKFEEEDQLKALRYPPSAMGPSGTHQPMGPQVPPFSHSALSTIAKEQYIDKTRIGAFGQVYGGYITSLLLSSEESMLRCGAVLSPITDFELYASAFSERYLGLPKPDRRAYEMTNLAYRASQFVDKKFLIIHPTADEKVHFQHTAKFISKLISEKANYTLQIYPDEGHFIHSEATKQHLSQSLVNFFEECFRLPDKVLEEAQQEESEDEG
ncbi:hypothetical protein P4O66_009902 [Electrophorus voltai]|uniref:A-type potassium channel modulatory protein DPP6 n=1 Tax=Electrophorus voltai TaxID=2609070 RepID=A0AAD9DUX8_9TELE|nr:hypothetical protein P4O66_009902 [Electrophorus voltai]